jgi:hypothetical protein
VRQIEACADLHQTKLFPGLRTTPIRTPAAIGGAIDEVTGTMSHLIYRLQAVLDSELYSPLQDLQLFNEVRINPEIRTIV